jgi:multidrug efflux system membrane fusion protein
VTFLPAGRHSTAAIGMLVAALTVPTLHCTKKKSGPPGPVAVPVLIATAASMDVPRELRGIGTVEAINSVSITARVSGQLTRIWFEEGSEVSEGDTLFSIDSAPYEATLRQRRATLAGDSVTMINAQCDAARYTRLAKKGYVTKEQYSSILSTAKEAQATVEADRALVTNALLNIEYCSILAPISGRTGNLVVSEGDQVSAGGAAPLVTINQISPIYVRFSVPEKNLGEIRERARRETLSVRVTLPPDSTVIGDGQLTFIDNKVDTATGTILLKALFQNSDRVLWPGQFVQTRLALGTLYKATVVPLSAVQPSQQGSIGYVVMPGDTVQLRRVIPGTTWGDTIVIEKGISPGERVVTDGMLQLRPGSKVAVKAGLTPAPDTAQRQSTP